MRTIIRAVGSLLVLLLLVIGVPWLLVALAGWPLPAAWPDWSQVWVDVRQLNIDAGWVTGGLAIAAWLLWAQMIWAVLFELIGMARAGRGVAARPAPLTLPVVTSLAARLIAGVVSVTLMSSSPSSAGVVGVAHELASALPDDHVEPVGPHQTPVAAPGIAGVDDMRARVVVADGETAWDVAVRVFGDGNLVAELLDHNDVSALDVQPGMELELPAGVSAPADEVTVVEGDHLWALSTRRLEEVGVEAPSNAQIAAHVEEMVEANQPAIADPDLIHPGEVFTLPALEGPSIGDAMSEADAVAPTSEAEPIVPDAVDTNRPHAGSWQASPQDRSSEEPPASVEAPSTMDDGPDGPDGSIGLVAAAGIGLITAAVGAIVARSQAHRIGLRRPGTTPRFAVPGEADRLMAETSDGDALDDLNRALRYLGMKRRSDGLELPELVGVLVYRNAIRLLLATPAGGGPAPFTAERDGMVWSITRPVVGLDVQGALNPYPTLVSVGFTDSARLLIDLEYAGSINLTGSLADVVDAMATMALQLATSPMADTIDVVCVGFGEELADFERVTVVPSIDAVQSAIHAHASQIAALVAATDDTAPGGRADGLGDWTPMIVFDPLSELDGNSSDLLNAVEQSPGSGMAAVVRSVDSASLSMELSEGRVAIPAYDVSLDRRPLTRVERTGLSGAVVASKEPQHGVHRDLLSTIGSSLRRHGSEAPEQQPHPDSQPHSQPEPTSLDGSEADRYQYIVRVLGPLRVDDADGQAVQFARSATPEFLAYLVHHRDGVEVGHVMDTLWPSTTARRTWIANVYADAARSLGGGLDVGVSLTPRPGADDDYHLAAGVTSDVEQFNALVSRAVSRQPDEAAELLTDALAMVEGIPYSNITSRWPVAEGHWQEATVMVDEAARCVATLALDRFDDPNLAEWATARGLLASPHSVELHRLRLRAAIALDETEGGPTSGLSPDAVFQHYQAVVMADDHRPEAASRLDSSLVELYESYRRSRGRPDDPRDRATPDHHVRQGVPLR